MREIATMCMHSVTETEHTKLEMHLEPRYSAA